MKSNSNQKAIVAQSINNLCAIYAEKPHFTPYLVTFMFHIAPENRLSIFRNTYQNIMNNIWTEHQEAYVQLMSRLEKRYNSKPNRMPKELAFIDYPGTREGNYSEYKLKQAPHIHSVMLLHPNTVERFEQLTDESFHRIVSSPRLPCLERIHSKPITPTQANFCYVANYNAKFAVSYPAENDPLLADVELFRANPKPIEELKKFRHLSKSPFKNMPTARDLVM